MYSNAKANALIRDLADRLNVRFLNNAGLNYIRQAYYVDSNNASWPYLVLSHGGNEAEGQPVVLIEISNVDMISKDIFGNQEYAYSPSLLQFGYELSGSAGSNPIPARADLQIAQFEAQTCGCEWQLKELANATAVTAANVNAAAAVVDIQPLYWPTKSV